MPRGASSIERSDRSSYAPTLTDLAPPVLYWITSTIEGAAAAHARFGA